MMGADDCDMRWVGRWVGDGWVMDTLILGNTLDSVEWHSILPDLLQLVTSLLTNNNSLL